MLIKELSLFNVSAIMVLCLMLMFLQPPAKEMACPAGSRVKCSIRMLVLFEATAIRVDVPLICTLSLFCAREVSVRL